MDGITLRHKGVNGMQRELKRTSLCALRLLQTPPGLDIYARHTHARVHTRTHARAHTHTHTPKERKPFYIAFVIPCSPLP